MAEDSECHGYARGAREGNGRAVIQFKDRQLTFHHDESLASRRRRIQVVDKPKPNEGSNVDSVVRDAIWLLDREHSPEYVRESYPAFLHAFELVRGLNKRDYPTTADRAQRLRELLEAEVTPPERTFSYLDPNNRHISVELEIDSPAVLSRGRKLHEALEKWQDSVVQDGSVHHGWEINTNPSSGAAFIQHMRELCDGLDQLKLTPSKSCGMHVHVNTRDMDFQDLRRLILLYTKVERGIFDACHPSRLGNQYSARCGHYFTDKITQRKPTEFKGDIHAMLYDFKPYKKPQAGSSLPLSASRLSNSHLTRACDYVSAGFDRGRVCTSVLEFADTWEPDEVVRFYDALMAAGATLHRSPSEDTCAIAQQSLLVQPGRSQTSAIHALIKKKQEAEVKKLAEKKGQKRHGLRYRALNLHSHFYRGSIEFRHHEGTADFNVITGFGRVCAELITKAVKMSDAQIKALPRNSRRALLEILPPDLQTFVTGEWVKNDAILNSSPMLKRQREQVWGLPSASPANSSAAF